MANGSTLLRSMIVVLAALGLQLPGVAPAAGQDNTLLLLVPVGARASSMGGTTTAFQGPDAAFYNPAGLAGLTKNAFMLHHSEFSATEQQMTAFSLVVTPLDLFSVAVSYQLFDRDEIPTTDATGQVTGELILRDHLLVTSAAVPLAPGLGAGLSYRIFQQRIDCNGRCGSAENVETAHAFDAGVRYSPPIHSALQLGLAVLNVSPGQDDDQPGAFPSRIRLGAAYDVLAATGTSETLALRLGVDLRDELTDLGDPKIAVGLELDLQEAVFLRAGYAPGEGLGTGAAVGIELRYDRFAVGVSRSFVNSQADTEPFQVSFGIDF
jgi:hypothetical protein